MARRKARRREVLKKLSVAYGVFADPMLPPLKSPVCEEVADALKNIRGLQKQLKTPACLQADVENARAFLEAFWARVAELFQAPALPARRHDDFDD